MSLAVLGCARMCFQERPGALGKFLKHMVEAAPNERCLNFSLFYYRNHGADIGQVLVGMQVPDDDMDEFNEFLHNLGYFYHEESENDFYVQFLR